LSVILHRIGEYLKMGIATLRYEGALPLLLRMMRVACQPFGMLLTVSFCHRDLTVPVVAPEAAMGVEVTRLADAQIGELAPVVASQAAKGRPSHTDVESAERRIREKLALGGVCFVATYGGNIINYNWVYPGVPWQVWGPIRFEPKAPTDALCDGAFTVEEWRGKGLHGTVHASMLQFLQRSGCTTAYTLLSIDNRSSRKALTRLGYSFGSYVVLIESRRSGRTREVRFGRRIPQFQVRRSVPRSTHT
jgi:RimJ/RimL family protein N-acetyltransferase